MGRTAILSSTHSAKALDHWIHDGRDTQWHGIVASIIRRMNDVTPRWARLVLGWVTIFEQVYLWGCKIEYQLRLG